MKLHEDKFAFLNIINLIHEDSSIRADILEKDYYVTLLPSTTVCATAMCSPAF